MLQSKPEQLKRQQEILKVLGYYTGPIDGTWGPETIKAKKRLESSKDFVPGIPNGGLPFKTTPPFPAGLYLLEGLLHSPLLESKPQQPVEPVKVKDKTK